MRVKIAVSVALVALMAAALRVALWQPQSVAGQAPTDGLVRVPGVVHGMRSFLMQDEYGQVLEAHSISAGLDYPGVGPEHAHLAAIGRARYVNATDQQVLDGLQILARTEGIIPALESAHAVAWVIRAAGTDELPAGSTVMITLSGRGDKDAQQVMDILKANG